MDLYGIKCLIFTHTTINIIHVDGEIDLCGFKKFETINELN